MTWNSLQLPDSRTSRPCAGDRARGHRTGGGRQVWTASTWRTSSIPRANTNLTTVAVETRGFIGVVAMLIVPASLASAAAGRREERYADDPDRHATTFRAGLSVPAED
ncbi:hypothetical protein ACQP2K_25005 [Microbispora siamensis]